MELKDYLEKIFLKSQKILRQQINLFRKTDFKRENPLKQDEKD